MKHDFVALERKTGVIWAKHFMGVASLSYENPVQVGVLISIGGQGLDGKQLTCGSS